MAVSTFYSDRHREAFHMEGQSNGHVNTSLPGGVAKPPAVYHLPRLRGAPAPSGAFFILQYSTYFVNLFLFKNNLDNSAVIGYDRNTIWKRDEGESTPLSASQRAPDSWNRDRPDAGEHGSGAARPSERQGATGLPVTAEGVAGRPE